MKLPSPVILDDDTKVYTISKILKLVLTPEKFAELPIGPIKITIGGDSGGDGSDKCVKIGFFLNDVQRSISTKNFFILSVKHGGDRQ